MTFSPRLQLQACIYDIDNINLSVCVSDISPFPPDILDDVLFVKDILMVTLPDFSFSHSELRGFWGFGEIGRAHV